MKKTILLLIFSLAFAFSYAQQTEIDRLKQQAKTYREQQEYEKSNACYEKIIAMMEAGGYTSLIPSMREFIAINDLYLGQEALENEEFAKAKVYFDKALENVVPQSKVYYTAQTWMGSWYGQKCDYIRRNYGDLQEALELSLAAEKYYTLAQKPAQRLRQQLSRVAVLQNLSREQKAVLLLDSIVAECKDNAEYREFECIAFFHLGCIELNNELFQKAIVHLEKCYEMGLPMNSEYAKLAANRLHSLYTYHIPDAKKADLWKTNALRMGGDSNYESDVMTYSQAMTDILDNKEYAKGVSSLTALIKQCEKRDSYPLTRVASYYKLRAYGRFLQQQYQLSVNDYQKAISNLTKAGDVGKQEIATVWYRLTIPYYYLNNQEATMIAADNCVKATLDYYGPWHSETMEAYSMHSNYAGLYNLKEQALADRRQCFDIISHNIAQNFVYLTASERSAYWKKFLDETTVMFTFAHKLNEFQSAYTDDLFNQQLMAKGLLLNAESALQRAVNENAELNASYQKIRQLRLLAESDETNPYEEEAANREADQLERSLGNAANMLYQFMDFLKVKDKDVRAKLKTNELAIEFVDYRVDKDSVMYAALVMSPQWEHVRFLPLIEQRELKSLKTGLADKIWQPIMDIAPSGVTTLYFAPTGLLYQLPIESETLKNGKLISDLYQLYRLSSTRWLAYKGDQTVGKDAVVYGGLRYDASVKEMLAEADAYLRIRGNVQQSENLRWSVDSLDFLPGTETEAKEIVDIINNAVGKGLHAEIYLGLKGTETSFKALDGQQKQIIHIGTHGFYQKGSTKDNADINAALSRCGLFFAGAENKRFGEELPKDLDDGILTAQEIAQMDLRGLDMVVLSACETGQGQISSDGVFGLQRGFKKAGANSILMSLWRVDDAATCLLMTEFYKNWIGGMSKHDALENAKQTVRSHSEKGWNDPKFWAAFILLDGLD